MEENAIQLRITTDMDALPAAIEFNYAELKGALESYLARFDGLVVTEDQIRQATVDRAEINRVAKTIARARIDTKKRYLEPFELFEARAKELEGLCKQVEGKIAEQLEEFERERTEKKLAETDRLWHELRGQFFREEDECGSPHWDEFLAEKVNPRTKGCWLNKGATRDVVEAEMRAEYGRCREVLEMVKGMYAEADEEVKAKARLRCVETFDLQLTVQAVNAFKAERETLAAARRAKEERERAEAEAKATTPTPPPEPQPSPTPAPAPAPAGDSEEEDDEDVVIAPQPAKRITITLRVTGTKEQFARMSKALDDIGIVRERI